MKTFKKSFLLLVPVANSQGSFMNGTTGYIVGGVIAAVIMGYLVYSLLKPEKF